MLKFSPCIEMFWPDVAFADRIAKAAALGYQAYEFWQYWNKDLDAVERATKDSGLDVAVCCVKTAFMADSAPMLLPEGKDDFVAAVRECLTIRDRLGCQGFIVTTGSELEGVSRADQHRACVEALEAAAPIAEGEGVTLVLEPLNLLVDHAGYYLGTYTEGFEILEEVNSPAVKLLFDIYHMQISEGNLTPTIVGNIKRIGHFHIANHPGRHEPAIGEINYPHILNAIREAGYDNYLGLEFSPSDHARTEDILKAVIAMA